jgi:hypothetical protein
MCSRPFETRSLPALARCFPRSFTFYVAFPKSSIRPLGFARLCRSRPRGSVHSLLPSSLYLDHSHCPRACASYPSYVAVYPRYPDRDVFYACHDVASAEAGRCSRSLHYISLTPAGLDSLPSRLYPPCRSSVRSIRPRPEEVRQECFA